MDDELDQAAERPVAQRHDRWSFIVLAADLAYQLTQQVADTLEATTHLLLQHREFRAEESKFYEVVSGFDDAS